LNHFPYEGFKGKIPDYFCVLGCLKYLKSDNIKPVVCLVHQILKLGKGCYIGIGGIVGISGAGISSV